VEAKGDNFLAFVRSIVVQAPQLQKKSKSLIGSGEDPPRQTAPEPVVMQVNIPCCTSANSGCCFFASQRSSRSKQWSLAHLLCQGRWIVLVGIAQFWIEVAQKLGGLQWLRLFVDLEPLWIPKFFRFCLGAEGILRTGVIPILPRVLEWCQRRSASRLP